jgi:hypothetical protein
MKKPAAKRKRPHSDEAKMKTRSSRRDKPAAGVDLGLLRRLLDALPGEDRSLEDMIEEFIAVDPTDIEDMPEVEAMSELAEELDRLRVDANGGDPGAREALKRAREIIDEAALRDEIHPGALMMLGRAFEGSHVDIGDPARASLGRMIDMELLHEPGDAGYQQLLQPLMNDITGDDFVVHEEVRCLSRIFPLEYRSRMIESFAREANARARRSVVGFLLDSDDSAALAAIRGLGAVRGRLDDTTGRRIDLIRPWLSAVRREALDADFPPLPAQNSAPTVVKTVASACDGSGASSLIATYKRGARFDVVALMLKATGVADTYVDEGLTKAQASKVEDGLRATLPSTDTPLETWLRLVRLALGRNLAAGAPPPFELVRVVEAIGVAPLEPDLSTSAQIIESLLPGAADRDNAQRLRTAHEAVLDSDVTYSWFEGGEAVEDVLRPARAIEDGAKAVLDHHLPKRRAFWASQCALTSLALSPGSAPLISQDLALVGRDIAGDAALGDIPLMRQIAERTAIAFFSHRA